MKQIPEHIKQQAIALRHQGKTYAEISKELQVGIDWCKRNLKSVQQGWLYVKTFLQQRGVPCVYYFTDDLGLVTYVGSSTRMEQRFYKHKASSEFFKNSKTLTIETYSTYSEMLFNEAQHIAKHKPRYNTRGVSSEASAVEIPCLQSVSFELAHYDKNSRSP